VRCTFAGGTRETRRRTSASAVNVKVTPFFGVYWYRPSSRRRRRDSETGPRAPYLHRRSRPCRSLPCTAVSACSENPAPTATRRRGGDGGSSSPRGRCRASHCAASYSSERPWSLEVREVLLRAPQHPHQDGLDLGGVWRGQLHQLARRRPQRLCHQPVKMRRDLSRRSFGQVDISPIIRERSWNQILEYCIWQQPVNKSTAQPQRGFVEHRTPRAYCDTGRAVNATSIEPRSASPGSVHSLMDEAETEKLLGCLDDSFVRSANRLVALANVDHDDWFTDGATSSLNSERLRAIANVFRADTVNPAGAAAALRQLLRVQNAASLRVEAWALLQAMDRALGASWVSKFRNEGAVRLRTGALFPIGQLPLKELFAKRLVSGTKLSAQPSSRNPTHRFLEHLGRWTGHGVSVRLEFHREVVDCRRVAFCLPNAAVTPASFSIERRETMTGDAGFYALRPTDESAQWTAIEALLERARGDGADLVLFPELCMSEALQKKVRAWRDEVSFAGAVLAGSAHLVSEVSNRARLTVGEYEHDHHKMNPYVLRPSSPFFPAESFERTEVVRPQRELVLHFFGTLSVAVLVCKDFLEEELLAALALLRPSLVLVAALSDTTTVFRDAAGRVRDSGQALSFVANAPIGEVPGAMVFLPLRNERDEGQADQRLARGTDGYRLVDVRMR
jgi:hypothetical protein